MKFIYSNFFCKEAQWNDLESLHPWVKPFFELFFKLNPVLSYQFPPQKQFPKLLTPASAQNRYENQGVAFTEVEMKVSFLDSWADCHRESEAWCKLCVWIKPLQ